MAAAWRRSSFRIRYAVELLPRRGSAIDVPRPSAGLEPPTDNARNVALCPDRSAQPGCSFVCTPTSTCCRVRSLIRPTRGEARGAACPPRHRSIAVRRALVTDVQLSLADWSIAAQSTPQSTTLSQSLLWVISLLPACPGKDRNDCLQGSTGSLEAVFSFTLLTAWTD